MSKISPVIATILSSLAMIYALFDNFNKEIFIASFLVLVVSIIMLVNNKKN
jgi:hypothetical protein